MSIANYVREKVHAVTHGRPVAQYNITVGGLPVTLHRTVRVLEGQMNSLPASLGHFPLYSVDAYRRGLPKEMQSGYFMPMYKHEAMWIGFGRSFSNPVAVMIGAGMINAVTGEKLDAKLAKEQNYLTVPPQPWIDGWKDKDKGTIYQFVAAELGSKETVEGQLTGEEKFGGIQIAVFGPKPGVSLMKAPRPREHIVAGTLLEHETLEGFDTIDEICLCAEGTAKSLGPNWQHPHIMYRGADDVPIRRRTLGAPVKRMGLGRGGEIEQSIYPDPYGFKVWASEPKEAVTIHMVSSEQFKEITGYDAPPSPITIQTYEQMGMPWFGLFDKNLGDVKGSGKFGKLKPVSGGQHGYVVQEPVQQGDTPKPPTLPGKKKTVSGMPAVDEGTKLLQPDIGDVFGTARVLLKK